MPTRGFQPAVTLRCALLVTLALGCAAAPRNGAAAPGDPVSRGGDEISVCGRLFHTGTRVILWNDPHGYDAYRPHCHFEPSLAGPSEAPDRIARYGSYRGGLDAALTERVETSGWTLEDLQQVISQVVIHYDQCGTSRRCFEVLHDIRGLSCHFLLDLDGTIYQTLDLKERAWHAAHANDRSIGIEIANIGCYTDPRTEVLSRWYTLDGSGLRVTLPERFRDHLPAEFVARPSRQGVFQGPIHGVTYYQYDFTEAQYQALEHLLTALCRIFPGIPAQAPVDGNGNLLLEELPEDQMSRFQGFVGHFHLTPEKRDPGPAFDWSRILERVGARLR